MTDLSPDNYYITGKGPVLVLLHGWLANKNLWDDLSHELSKYFTIISLDLPGFGINNDAEFENLDEYAELVKKIIDKFALSDPYYLMGNSLGGTIAAMLALKYPDSIKAYITLMSPISNKQLPLIFRKKTVIRLLKSFTEIKKLSQYRRNLLYKKWLKMHIGTNNDIQETGIKYINESKARFTNQMSEKTAVKLGLELASFDISGKLRNNLVPALYIINKKEKIVNHSSEVYVNVRNVTLDILDSPEHSVLHFDKDFIENKVVKFFRPLEKK